jgi:acetoin utilization deacetylase AcuC-like enzyme
MTTVYFHHPIFLRHLVPEGHPERPDRLRAIATALETDEFAPLQRREAPEARLSSILACHPEAYVEALRRETPEAGFRPVDPDTALSPLSFAAALHAAGAACAAVDAVAKGEARNAFCAVRPPGHHAEPSQAMGFCLFGNAVIAARHAQKEHGVGRVAIVDFDVHHGNGTQAMVEDDATIFYASTHEWGNYPGTGAAVETGVGNIVNVPLPSGTSGIDFRDAFEQRIIPALNVYEPELVILSAGFDAHERDPLGGLRLKTEDFGWLTERLTEAAARCADGRIVSLLEGGYDLDALAASVAAHLRALMASAGVVEGLPKG